MPPFRGQAGPVDWPTTRSNSAWMDAWRLAAVPLLCVASVAAADDCRPASMERAAVSGVVDAALLQLADGRTIRLAGVFVPPKERAGAVALVASLVAGNGVSLGNLSGQGDRYGRFSAHAFAGGGGWIQGELLRRGLAIALTFRDDRACAKALLTAETEGRLAKAGLWASPDFAIARSENPSLLGQRNGYQIVEGRVLSVGKTATTVYLDFGRNWATDFTVTVSTSDAALFESEGMVLHDLEGRRVRVRGWLAESNGPMIKVDHPEQIEVLER